MSDERNNNGAQLGFENGIENEQGHARLENPNNPSMGNTGGSYGNQYGNPNESYGNPSGANNYGNSNPYGNANPYGNTNGYGTNGVYGTQYNGYQNSHETQFNNGEKPMTLGDWMITLLVLAIPCVGLVMLFVWGFGGSASTTKKNFCRASLIWAAIGLVLWFLLAGVFAAQVASFGSFY